MAQKKLALIVGNSEYEDPNLARLASPIADVHLLSSVFKDPEIGGFDSVTELLNETEGCIRRNISTLFARKQSDDLLLLYFSTHGILDENGRLYLAARDTQRDLLKATSIPATFITDEMDNTVSKRQVLILDCCHSGAFARGTKGILGSSVSTASIFEGHGFGRVVLTATDSTQYAWDGDSIVGENAPTASVFTRHLIEGLRTGAADEDDDGQVTLDELYNYVYRQVSSEPRTPRQTPYKWSYRQQGTLVIARSPNSGRKLTSLPDHLQRALESDFPTAREGAIRDLERLINGPSIGLSRAAEHALDKISIEDDSRKIQKLANQILLDFRKSKGERTKILSLSEVISDSRRAEALESPPKGDIPDPRLESTSPAFLEISIGEPTPTILTENDRSSSLPLARLPRIANWRLLLTVAATSLTLIFLVVVYTTLNSETSPLSSYTPAETQAISYAAEVCPGCLQLGDLKTGWLQESIAVGAKESFTLKSDSTYVAAAACNPEPCDIDLYLIGSNRSDTHAGSQASLQITPSLGGTIAIGVEMHQCEAAECSYALGIWTHKRLP